MSMKAHKGNRFTSELQLSAAMLVVALAVLYFSGISTAFWVCCGLSALFLFSSFMERSAMRRAERFAARQVKRRNDDRRGSESVSAALRQAGFLLVAEDGDEWHRKIIPHKDGSFVIELLPDPPLAEKSLPAALEVAAAPDRFMETISRAQAEAETHSPGIGKATLLHLSYNTAKKPGLGELYFEDGAGNSWAGLYRNGKVTDLNAAD